MESSEKVTKSRKNKMEISVASEWFLKGLSLCSAELCRSPLRVAPTGAFNRIACHEVAPSFRDGLHRELCPRQLHIAL